MSIKGKALLVINRLADSHGEKHWDVHPFIQTCSGNWEFRNWAYEEFQLMEWDLQPLPGRAHRMQVGETIRVAVAFEIFPPSRDYSDDGSTLVLNKVRTLRHQYPKEIYRAIRPLSA